MTANDIIGITPDAQVNAKDTFAINMNESVPAFSNRTELVPEIDENYVFDDQVTQSILAGFKYNRRVMIHGLHGTGKSSHIEQVAARLNWPTLRINLDGHLSRHDLVGKDAVVLEDNKQVTVFQEGLLPWAIQRPVALVFDEFDAGRPEVMFVIQRVLEQNGQFTLLEKNKVIRPHPDFRIFATSNTIGLGNLTGLYHGTQMINQAMIDRWNVVSKLDYLDPKVEASIVIGQVAGISNEQNYESLVDSMVALANLTRHGFNAGDLSTLMSPRTVIAWAENILIFKSVEMAFRLSFLNKCDQMEHPILAEYYQRCFNVELDELIASAP
jgi:cobaltochelatase CobS